MSEPTAEVQGMLNSKAWIRVYALLTQAAQFRGLVTYGQVAELMGLLPCREQHGPENRHHAGINRRLGLPCGRPMLSAVAVSSTNRQPGPGFFGIAEDQGRIKKVASAAEKRAFWEAEPDRVYEEWEK
jgi:hypothetical protein